MDKNVALKIVNPVLAILMVTQPLSGLLLAALDWDFFEGLHILGGVVLVCAAALHLWLNWKWVKLNLLKYGKRQQS